MALVKIAYHEIAAGTPLEFPVYSKSGKLLAAQGFVLQSESQVDRLLSAGAFKEGGPARSAPRRVIGGTMTSDGAQKSSASSLALEPVIADFPCAPTGPEVFQLSLKGMDDRVFRADYIGAVKQKTLLVAPPADTPQFEVGSVLNAKVFFGRHIYLFETRVLARHNQPNEILHLEYPEKTRRHTLRKHHRIEVNIPARVFRNDAATTAHEATVYNASLSGIAIRCPEGLLNVDDHFRVSLKLPFDDRIHAVTLSAVVRNSRGGSGTQAVGAEFWQLSDEMRNYLQSFIFESAMGTL